jgi:hypothetical protein
LRTKIRKGRVDKFVSLVDGHNAIYSRHVISEMSGAMCFGQHAMLKFPEREGSGIVSTSRFVYGQVFPDAFELPAQGGYTSLQAGATFKALTRVPTMTGETTDLTRYPARRGWENLVMIVSDDSAPFAWTAVTFPEQRYVWFALKDPRVLRNTVFWQSNAGRHYPPWSGRHHSVMGLEEVTANFHYGLAESAKKNPLSQKSFFTCIQLSPNHPLTINYIMVIATIPRGFDKVASINPTADGQAVTIRAASGVKMVAPVDVGFLKESL